MCCGAKTKGAMGLRSKRNMRPLNTSAVTKTRDAYPPAELVKVGDLSPRLPARYKRVDVDQELEQTDLICKET